MTATYQPRLTQMCHNFYALGQQIWNEAQVQGFSNTQINTICSGAKADRTAVTNTTHIAILSALAGL